jgi:rhodanese-related sulfurtransferase
MLVGRIRIMFENISVKNALKLVYEGKAILYDIRDEEAYRRGHLPMAQSVRRDHLEELLKISRHLQRNGKLVILYCDYGNQSMHLAKELSDRGYGGIASMVGGYHAYEGYVEARKKDFWTMEWKERG